MKKLIVPLALLLPLAVAAQPPSYNHIEGGFNYQDPPGRYGSSDNGIKIRGSYALDEIVFVRGGFSSHRFDRRTGPPGDRRTTTTDRDLLNLGVGLRVPTEQALDLYGAVDILFDFGDADDAGVRVEGGARSVLAGDWDTGGGVRVDFIDSRSNVQVFANTWYPVADQLSLGGELAVGDFDEVLLGARYNF